MKNPLRNMQLWQKFSAIGLIATVLCAIPLTRVVLNIHEQIAVAEAEDAGIDPIRTALALQRELQLHRGLSSLALYGDAKAETERKAHADQVQQQLGTLQGMVPSIQKTSELVQEIAAASGEQNASVDQITGAMNHLSSSTQQTASASEELSATAEELSAQAQRLQELMAFFKLAQDQAPASRGRPANTGARQPSAVDAPAPAAGAGLRFGQMAGAPAPRSAVPMGHGGRALAPAGDVDESSFARF